MRVAIIAILGLMVACAPKTTTEVFKEQTATIEIRNNSFTLIDLCYYRSATNIVRLETVMAQTTHKIEIPLSFREGSGEISFCVRPIGGYGNDIKMTWFGPSIHIDEHSFVKIEIEPSVGDDVQQTFIAVYDKSFMR